MTHDSELFLQSKLPLATLLYKVILEFLMVSLGKKKRKRHFLHKAVVKVMLAQAISNHLYYC